MSRTYARVMAAIWRNRDFIALTSGAQRVYLMLVTQPDISAAGTLPLCIRRWASLAQDSSPESINNALAELAAGKFVVVDRATDELLVRSFVKWDGGMGNSKRRPVILEAAAEVVSPALREALAVEFRKVGLPCEALVAPAGGPDDDPHGGQDDEGQNTLFPQVDSPSGSASRSASSFSRVVGTDLSSDVPQPSTSNQQTSPAAPTVNQRAQEIARAYTDAVPLSNFPAILGIAKKAIGVGKYTDDQIRDALLRIASDGRVVTVDSLRIELEGRRQPNLRLVSGGYQPFRNPVDQSVYDEGI